MNGPVNVQMPLRCGQRAALDRGGEELAGEQDVAQGAAPQQVLELRRRPALRSVSTTSWSSASRVSGSRSSRSQHPVLPQADDGVGDVLAPAHGRQHPHAVLGHELVGQRGRGLVERVGVVDGEDRSGARARMASRARVSDAAASSTGSSGAKAPRGTARRRPGRPHPQGTACPRRRTARPPRPGGGTCPRPPRRRARRPGGSPAPPRRGRARTSRPTERPPKVHPATSSLKDRGPCYVVSDACVRSGGTDDRGTGSWDIDVSARSLSPFGRSGGGGRTVGSGRADAVNSRKDPASARRRRLAVGRAHPPKHADSQALTRSSCRARCRRGRRRRSHRRPARGATRRPGCAPRRRR